MTDLSPALADRAAALLVSGFLRGATAGGCLRLDHLPEADCHVIRDAARAQLPAPASGAPPVQISVLGAANQTDDLVVSPERAIELRNRKEVALLLLVPTGVDSPAASSLENSFEAIDLDQIFRAILRDLVNHLPRDLRDLYNQVIAAQPSRPRVFTQSRQARAEYVLALEVAATAGGLDEAYAAAGANLHLLGMIPDRGGAAFTERLAENAACVAALVKPARSQDDASTRLRACPLRQDDGTAYRTVERFVVAVPRLSDRSWLRALADPVNEALTFDRWPLNPTTVSNLEALYVEPFAVNGIIPASTGLRDPQDGTLPVCSAKGGFVKIGWKAEPAKPQDVAKWSVELIPSVDYYGPDTDFDVDLPQKSPRGATRTCKLTINLEPEDLDRAPKAVVLRVQALDRNGQVLRLADGNPAEAISQEFMLDDTAVSDSTSVRRESAPSLPIARLRAAAVGADAEAETCEGWQESDLAYLQLRFTRNHAGRLALSIPLRELETRVLSTPETGGAYAATVASGQILAAGRATPVDPSWVSVAGKALGIARRDFFDAVLAQTGRGLIEAADFDEALTAAANRYTATYLRVLRGRDGAHEADLRALTTLDTLCLRIDVGRRAPVEALVMLPTHPLRVAWYAGYWAALEEWRRELRAVPEKERPAQVDLELLTRLSPARLPFLLADEAGQPYVFAQNLRLLHGLYLPVREPDPATATSEIIAALGLPAVDVSVGEVPASRLADRIGLYRDTHQQPPRMRVLATNPGSGAFLADALRLATTDREDDADGDAESSLPPHLQVQAFGEGASETNPLPGLRELQRELLENRSRTRRGRGFLDPALELSAAPLSAIDTAQDAHLAVLTDVSRPEMVIRPPAAGSVSFNGLITQPITEPDAGGWITGVGFPTAKGAEVTEIHRRFAEAVTALFGPGRPAPAADDGDTTILLDNGVASAAAGPGGMPLAQVRMEVTDVTAKVLDVAHDRADWVVVLDRFLGPEAFDDPAARTGSGRRYILDYAPEFLDGLGHQMAITTAHRADVEKLFHPAMLELGFDQPDESVSAVIDELLLVSGRLVLAATKDDNQAKEAVAVAAVIAHLRRGHELDNTVVVPVDAHPELFGVHAQRRSQTSQQRARRCDLLLVRFPSSRRVSVEAVEVKSRGMLGDSDLAHDIASQVRRTNELVEDLFFAEPARIDRPLQRARFASLLRFYLRRADRHRLITSELELSRASEAIERLDHTGLTLETRGSGYIVLRGEGADDFEQEGVRIRTLSASGVAAGAPAPPAPARSPQRPAPVAPPAPGGVPEPAVSPEPVDISTAAVAAVIPTPAVAATVTPAQAPPPEFPESVRVLLGRTLPPEEDVVWEASTSGSPHLFILGIPGQGKSETTIRLLRGAADEGLPALVFDFHGQFGSDARRPSSMTVYDAVEGLPFSPFELTEGGGRLAYRINATSIAEIFGYVCNFGDIQRDVFYEALVRAYEDHGHGGPSPSGIPTIDEVRVQLATVEKERGVQNVAARCRALLEYGLFTDNTGVTVQDLIRQGVVIDLHGFAEVEQAQVAAGAFLLRKIYRDMFSWGQTGRLRLAIVLDEAHRLAKDTTLPKLMKEGRKFGVVVLVASQGLDDFHPDVLANAGTKIIFRTNYPQSRKAIGFLRTRTGRDLSDELEQLPVGNAYVQTPAMPSARRTRMFRPDAK